MATQFYEIFRAGNYPQGSFDAEDLKKIAENYDPSFLEAPVTLDHGWGGPAFGWINELKAEGERLLASFKDVSDRLKCLTATKAYKRHSVEIYNDIEGRGPYLKALSMLGALSPQVKGMESIEFSSFSEKFPEGESQKIEFDEPVSPEGLQLSEFVDAWLEAMELPADELAEKFECDAELIKEIIGGKFDEEATPEIMTSFGDVLESINESKLSIDAAKALVDQFSERTPESLEDEDDPVSLSEFNEMRERMETLEQALEKERNDKKQFADENEQIKFDQRKKDFTSFLDKQVEAGKLLPKLKDKATALFSHLDGMKAGDDESSPLKLFKDILSNLPALDLEEQAPRGAQAKQFSTPQEMADAATAYMQEQKKKGKHVSVAQAVNHVKNNKA